MTCDRPVRRHPSLLTPSLNPTTHRSPFPNPEDTGDNGIAGLTCDNVPLSPIHTPYCHYREESSL